MKVVIALLAGIGLGSISTAAFLHKPGKLVRPADGFILGGFAFPAAGGELQVISQAPGIDSTLYTVRVAECGADTIWDIGFSGQEFDHDVVEIRDEEHPRVLRLSAHSHDGLGHPDTRGPFTSVSVENDTDYGCVRLVLSRLAADARPAFILPEPLP